MKARRLLGWFVGMSMALSVVVAGCGLAPVSSATLELTSAPPEQVVESFYAWYLDDAGNVLSGGAYRSSEYLTGEFVQRVDGIVASFEKGGYDPFLCAQDVPARFSVDEPLVSDGEATVVVHQIWNPGTEYESVHDVEVVLRMADGVWKIADIVCVAPEAVAMPPEAVVRGFYDWYLGYIGDPASVEIRNPLVDGAYRSSAYLTEEFVQRVDEIVASFDKGGYDPFLCAQDIPRSFSVDAALGSGEEATVVVHEIWNPGTEFESVLDTAVTLRMVDGVWKIADVACSVPDPVSPMPEGPVIVTPEGAVTGFYSWYLWYARNVGNVLADETYRQSEYLTEEFVQEVSETVASFDKGGYDPFLCAQDVPESYTVDAPVVSGAEASAVVHTSFEGHAFTVELQETDGRWAISGVVCESAEAQPEDAPAGDVPVAGWQLFSDEGYGFQMRYPAGWTYEDVPPVPAGMEVPEGMKALKRVLIFAPQGWDGVAPPLYVEVVEGSEEECARVYAPPSSTESVEIGGRAVVKAVEGSGEVQVIRYIFPSPVDGNVRVVVTDYIVGFPERAEGNEGVIEVIQQMLSTVEFVE